MVKNIYVRLQPSTVHGVGVFAIKDIPQNFTIFPSNCTWKKVKKSIDGFQRDVKKRDSFQIMYDSIKTICANTNTITAPPPICIILTPLILFL